MKMDNIPSHIKREIAKLVPASIQNDITCFCFYDHHPCDAKEIDVIVCTSRGEVIELFNRQPCSSITLGCSLVPREITIYRTSNGNLFYLVSTFEKLYVLKAVKALEIHKVIHNLEKYVIDDTNCSGKQCLRVWCNDDAVPQVLDDNFNIISHEDRFSEISDNNEDKFASTLKTKLSEAKFMVASNESKYKRLLSLRQAAGYAMLQDKTEDPLKVGDIKEVVPVVFIETYEPWIKQCNGQIVLILTLVNNSEKPLNHVQVLFKNNTKNSIHWTTRLYQNQLNPPYWKQITSNSVLEKSKISITVTSDIQDFIEENKIVYEGVIMYEMNKKLNYISFKETVLSWLDTVKANFEVLPKPADTKDFLAVLSTMYSTKIKLSYIPSISDKQIPDLVLLLRENLQMEVIKPNVFGFCSSPYNFLNGVIIIVPENFDWNQNEGIDVCLRSESQLPCLIRHFYDAIPYRLILTTPEIIHTSRSVEKNTSETMEVDLLSPEMNNDILTFDTDSLIMNKERQKEINNDLTLDDMNKSKLTMDSDEQIMHKDKQIMDKHMHTKNMHNLAAYSSCLNEQMSLILNYFDECMVAMSKSSNSDILDSIGTKIDLLVTSKEKFSEFLSEMNKKVEEGNAVL